MLLWFVILIYIFFFYFYHSEVHTILYDSIRLSRFLFLQYFNLIEENISLARFTVQCERAYLSGGIAFLHEQTLSFGENYFKPLNDGVLKFYKVNGWHIIYAYAIFHSLIFWSYILTPSSSQTQISKAIFTMLHMKNTTPFTHTHTSRSQQDDNKVKMLLTTKSAKHYQTILTFISDLISLLHIQLQCNKKVTYSRPLTPLAIFSCFSSHLLLNLNENQCDGAIFSNCRQGWFDGAFELIGFDRTLFRNYVDIGWLHS